MTPETTTKKLNPSLEELIEDFAKKTNLQDHESKKLAISLLSSEKFEECLLELATSKDISTGDIATLCSALGILSNKPHHDGKELSKISSALSPDAHVPEFEKILSEVRVMGSLESIRSIHSNTGRQGGDFVIEGPDADTQENKKVHLEIKIRRAPEVARKQEIENLFNRPEAVSLANAMRWDKEFKDWVNNFYFDDVAFLEEDYKISPSDIMLYSEHIFNHQLAFFKPEHNDKDKSRFKHYFIEFLRAGRDCSDGVCINPETFFTKWLPAEFENQFEWVAKLNMIGVDCYYGDGSEMVNAVITKTKEIFLQFHDFTDACLSKAYSNHGRDKTNNYDFEQFRRPHFHFDIASDREQYKSLSILNDMRSQLGMDPTNATICLEGKLTEFRGLFSNEIRSRCTIFEYKLIVRAIVKSIELDEYRGVHQTTFEKINNNIAWAWEKGYEEEFGMVEQAPATAVPKEHQIRMLLRFLSHANLIENNGKYYEVHDSATFLERANESIQHFRKPHFKHDAAKLSPPPSDDIPF